MKAAAGRFRGSDDVSSIVGNWSFCVGQVGRVVEGLHHAHGGGDNAALDNESGSLDVGHENPKEKICPSNQNR